MDLPGSRPRAPVPTGLPRPPRVGAGAAGLGRARPTGRARRGHQRGELVMVGVRTPGVDAHLGRRGDDRAYSVFTVREGRIVALRDCRDRQWGLPRPDVKTR